MQDEDFEREEITPAIQEPEAPASEETAQQTPQDKESDKDENFARLRKKSRKVERENEELKQRLADIERKLQTVAQPQQIDDGDDLMTKRQVAELLQRQAQEQYEKNYAVLLKTQYPDYNEVMSEDNLERLEEEVPEIALAIMDIKDKVKAGAAAYKAIKKLLKDDVKKDIDINRKAMQKQAEKPSSPAAYDKRPIAKVARYTDQDYAALWEETQRYASQA